MAGASKTGSKATGTKGLQKVRMLNGKVVKPVLYVGWAVGQGKYMAGSVDNTLVIDEQTGRPHKFRDIGQVRHPV